MKERLILYRVAALLFTSYPGRAFHALAAGQVPALCPVCGFSDQAAPGPVALFCGRPCFNGYIDPGSLPDEGL